MKTKHRDKSEHVQESQPESPWDAVINSGIIQLREAEAEAARLRVSIQYFEGRKKSGEPFPGEEKFRKAGLL